MTTRSYDLLAGVYDERQLTTMVELTTEVHKHHPNADLKTIVRDGEVRVQIETHDDQTT